MTSTDEAKLIIPLANIIATAGMEISTSAIDVSASIPNQYYKLAITTYTSCQFVGQSNGLDIVLSGSYESPGGVGITLIPFTFAPNSFDKIKIISGTGIISYVRIQ